MTSIKLHLWDDGSPILLFPTMACYALTLRLGEDDPNNGATKVSVGGEFLLVKESLDEIAALLVG